MDINNLRVLNDYLNQTIEVLSRQQAIGGLTHSPFAMGMNPLAQQIFGQVPGLSHSPYTPFTQSYNTGFNQPFTTPFATSPWAQTGLSHSSSFGAVNPWQRDQLTQAIVARTQVLEAMCRSLGIPV